MKGISHQLAWLNLKGKVIIPGALDSLQNFPNLIRLHLAHTNVHDNMLRSLSALKKLEYLNLYCTAITNAGLTHLASLKNLGALYLWQTKVTAVEAGRLKTSNPHLQIYFGASENEGL